MSTRILTLTVVILGTSILHAERPAPAAGVEATVAATVKPYVLQRKSAFTAGAEDERAPFWPIGWVKQKASAMAKTETPAAPRVTLDESAFKLSSILLGNPSLAIINGRTYSEGEILRQPRAAGGAATVSTSPIPASARIRVQRIDDGSVTLQYQEQKITVMIRRPELLTRSAEEVLLTEDRP